MKHCDPSVTKYVNANFIRAIIRIHETRSRLRPGRPGGGGDGLLLDNSDSSVGNGQLWDSGGGQGYGAGGGGRGFLCAQSTAGETGASGLVYIERTY